MKGSRASRAEGRSAYALRDSGGTGESEGEGWREGLPRRGAKKRGKRKVEEIAASTLQPNLIYRVRCLSEFEGATLVQEFLKHARRES